MIEKLERFFVTPGKVLNSPGGSHGSVIESAVDEGRSAELLEPDQNNHPDKDRALLPE